jgi:ABC-type bacteriocin/lantibiotic exporter with double-glycine peptidase domain
MAVYASDPKAQLRMILERAIKPLVYPWQLRKYIKRYYRSLIWLGLLGVLIQTRGYITPLLTRRIIDDAYPARDLRLFFILSGLMIFLNLASVGMQAYANYLSTYVGNLIQYRIRMKVFRALHRIPVSYVESHQSGMFLERIARDAEKTANILSSIIPRIISLLLTIVVTIALMANISLLVAGLVLAFVPIYYVFSSILAVKLRGLQQLMRKKDDEMTTKAVEAIQGVPTARLFGVGGWLKAKYRTLIRERIKVAFGILRANLIWGNLSWGVSYGWGVLLTVGGWYLVLKDRLTLGDAVALGMYIPLLLKPASEALGLYQFLLSSSVPAQRIIEVLNAAGEAGRKPSKPEFQISRTVRLEQVEFSYPDSNWKLKDVTLDLRCGESAVVIGATGSGKTTLLRILAGTYDTYTGDIIVDDINIRDLELSDYLRNVAMVMTDNFFFSGSIMENMLIARPHLDPKEVIEVARLVGAHEWLESLPHGYDTLLGVGGVRLSSGQMQKIAVLRALLKKSRLLLLDEITSSMDVESERKILDGLDTLRQNDCITIMTTHRLTLTTESWVNRVVVLDDGAILEQGSPRELYDSGGKYRALMDLAGLGKLLA